MWKRGDIAIFPLSHNIFNMSLTSGVKLHIHLLNVVVRFIIFLTSATLIFRGTISRSVSENPLEFEITRVDCIYAFRGYACMSAFQNLQRQGSILILCCSAGAGDVS